MHMYVTTSVLFPLMVMLEEDVFCTVVACGVVVVSLVVQT